HTPPGKGGEIQLTDALQTLAQRMSLYGLETEGRLYDAGDRVGFIEATVAFALKRPGLAAELRPVLRRLLDSEELRRLPPLDRATDRVDLLARRRLPG